MAARSAMCTPQAARAATYSHSYRVSDEDSYFQDDYKVTSRLTLNLGVRWDVLGAVTDVTGHSVNFYPNLALMNPGDYANLARRGSGE